MIKAILMDFNGVIIDDEPLQMQAYQELLKAEDIELTEEQYAASHGMDDRTFVEAAYRRAGREPELAKTSDIIRAKIVRWRELISDGLPIFPGAENFIRKMEQEFALGIVSMANREEIEHVLETSGLANCFSIIISAEDVSACKPDPECYHKGFNRLDAVRIRRGSNPMVHGDCLVVEDTAAGILAAKRAGLKALGVTNTVDARILREAGADSVTKTLYDWMPGSVRGVFV
jgi:beta-phosphoglucomutase